MKPKGNMLLCTDKRETLKSLNEQTIMTIGGMAVTQTIYILESIRHAKGMTRL